jgi:hypothetical protein
MQKLAVISQSISGSLSAEIVTEHSKEGKWLVHIHKPLDTEMARAYGLVLPGWSDPIVSNDTTDTIEFCPPVEETATSTTTAAPTTTVTATAPTATAPNSKWIQCNRTNSNSTTTNSKWIQKWGTEYIENERRILRDFYKTDRKYWRDLKRERQQPDYVENTWKNLTKEQVAKRYELLQAYVDGRYVVIE